jgi:hypothetical protein
VTDQQNDTLDSVVAQQAQLMVKKRLAGDFHQGLRTLGRLVAQPGGPPAREDRDR